MVKIVIFYGIEQIWLFHIGEYCGNYKLSDRASLKKYQNYLFCMEQTLIYKQKIKI